MPDYTPPDNVTLEIIFNKLYSMDNKLNLILELISSIDAHTTPCEEKQNLTNASMKMMMDALDKSPLSKNPAFQAMFEPIKKILENSKGGI